MNFVEFDSGPLVDAGFAAHRIDVGTMGDLPASLAVRSGLPVKAVAVDLPIGASEYLLAKPGITAIAQLPGQAGGLHHRDRGAGLRAARAEVGRADPGRGAPGQRQPAPARHGAGVRRGDASVVSVEQKVDYQQTHPTAKVLANVDTVSPPSYGYLLATTAALASPVKRADISDLTRRLILAQNWEKTHQSQWVTDYYVDVEHQTPAAARLILAAGGTETYVPITAAVSSTLQGVVDLMVGAGAWPKTFSVAPLYSAAVSRRYNALLKEVPQHG